MHDTNNHVLIIYVYIYLKHTLLYQSIVTMSIRNNAHATIFPTVDIII